MTARAGAAGTAADGFRVDEVRLVPAPRTGGDPREPGLRATGRHTVPGQSADQQQPNEERA